MTDVILFIQQHFLLFSAWVIIILVVAIYELYLILMAAKLVTPQGAIDLINHQGAVILDLRNQKDYNQGHIVNSVSLPAETIKNNLNKLKVYQSKIVIFVCANGLIAKRLANDLMKQQVIKDIRVLTNGIQAWKAAGLPLEKK